MMRAPLVRLAIATVAAVAIAAGHAGAASAAPTILYDCTPTPENCTGWYRTNVAIAWTILPSTSEIAPGTCADETLTQDSKAAYVACSATSNGRSTVELWLQIDKTPPRVTGGRAARPPDRSGWYRAPVPVGFLGADGTSGVRACSTKTYAGPDSAAARVTGTCTDIAGNTSAPLAFPLRYDATPPVVRHGSPSRKPDHGRWYNHPVRWRFRGVDALSGIAGCPTVRYRGPDGGHATVVGACGDRAGNVGRRAFRLHYDATAPAPASVRAIPRDRRVPLKIRAAADVHRMSIVRAPGLGGARDSTLYAGRARSFTDRRVHNRRRYRYTVIVRDKAANRSVTRVGAVPGARLISPPDGATLAAPPLLRWMPVLGASYYNVQLRRDGRKVLSIWPARPRLQLHARWRFAGRTRRLVPGAYSWEVWPGFGARAKARYGRRIGRAGFFIPAAGPTP
jgi:hypothetical protein